MMTCRIGHLCIMAAAVAAVGNSHLLTQGESVRVAAIAAGLGAYYWFCVRTRPGSAERPQQGISILALVSVFLFVQFDPAFSGANRSVKHDFLGWYSIGTSLLIVAAFVSVMLNHRGVSHPGAKRFAAYFSRWDGSVLAACGTAFLLLLATSFSADVAVAPALFTSAKLALSALLYAAVIGIYQSEAASVPGSQEVADMGRMFAITWRLLAVVFLAILAVGVGKSTYAHSRLAEGKDLLARGIYADALAPLESALMLSGMHSEEAQVALAEARLGLDDIQAAQAQISSARRLYVGSQTLGKRLGDAFSRTGHWNLAIAEYVEERRRREDPLYAIDELSRAYLGDGKLRELAELIRRHSRAPLLTLDSVDDRVRMAICLTEAGRYADARKELDAAAARSSANWSIEYGYGFLANRTTQWDNAVEHLRRAVEIEPNQIEPRLELGEALLELGELEAVQQQARHVLEIEPDRVRALGQLASVYMAQADLAGATDLVHRMTVVVNASQWQGPQGGQFGSNGSCWYDVELYPGGLSLSIQASGTQANGEWPVMVVSLDGQVIGSASVDLSDAYLFETQVERARNYRLSVSFINDSSSYDTEDRNLYVARATLQHLSVNR